MGCCFSPGDNGSNQHIFLVIVPKMDENRYYTTWNARRRWLGQMLAGMAAIGGLGLASCRQSQSKSGRPGRDTRFPEFSLAALDQSRHSSRDYMGRPLLFNLWATWCPPCRNEMADLESLHRTLAPRGLVLLAISIDENIQLAREFTIRQNLSFTVLSDPGQRWAASVLKAPGLPTSYLVGRDFLIKDVMVGPRAWADLAVQHALAAQLALHEG